MPNCTYCNSFFLFGGAKDDTGRYCNDQCRTMGNLLDHSKNLPVTELENLIDDVHQGDCPRCHGPGPVDIHKAHKIWSIVFLTSWNSSPELSCKKCGVQRQVSAFFSSSVMGWWGIPWGIIFTPVQMIKNIVEMLGGPKKSTPSELLERFVRIQATAFALDEEAQAAQADSQQH